MKYEDLLDKAKKELPEMKEEGGRFEIPEAIVEHSGKQTIIKNFHVISKTLRREPRHISKYLFKELAVPGTLKDNELILNGKISKEMVSSRLNDYIKNYVLCKSCGKPDTKFEKEGNLELMKCEACGAKSAIKKV